MPLTPPLPRDPCCGRFSASPVWLCCLGLTMALLAACSKPEPGTPAQPAPTAQASGTSVAATAMSTATSVPASAPAPAPPTEPVATSAPAPTAAAAAAAAPAADTGASAPVAALPPAIVAFQKQRDACDHLRGEDPYDKQRAAFLKAQLTKTCKGTDRALAALRKRFAQDPGALAALKDYENRIE